MRPAVRKNASISETSVWKDIILDAESSAKEAREGNHDRLIARLQTGHQPTREETKFLIDYLKGDVKLESHRPKSVDWHKRQDAMARIVEELQLGYSVKIREGRESYEITRVAAEGPIPNKQAVGMVATHFGVTDSTVRQAMTAHKKRFAAKQDR